MSAAQNEFHQLAKPPLGIISRDLWEQMRKMDLRDAINRYISAGMPVPQEWVDEFGGVMYRRLSADMIVEASK